MDTITGSASETIETISSDEEPSQAVVMAVAEAKGVDPLDLEPIYDVIDPDALNRILATADRPGSSVEVRFTVADCQVVVRADGHVVVTPPATADGNSERVVSLGD